MSRILISEHYGTMTTATGTASVTFNVQQGILKKIYIAPATATTRYDFKFTDYHSVDSFLEEDIEGTYSETDVGEPIYENFTLTIENSSADEEFTYLLVIQN